MNTIMSRQLLAWVQNHYVDDVELLLSDPSRLFDPRRLEEPAETIARFRAMGRELGLDFDAMAQERNAASERVSPKSRAVRSSPATRECLT